MAGQQLGLTARVVCPALLLELLAHTLRRVQGIQDDTDLENYRPDDRSFSDLKTLLELVARIPILDVCTPVEKFAIVRTGRLQRYKAGQTGFHLCCPAFFRPASSGSVLQ